MKEIYFIFNKKIFEVNFFHITKDV